MYRCPSKSMGKWEFLQLLLKRRGNWWPPRSSDASFTPYFVACAHREHKHPLSFCFSTENFSVSRCLSCDQSVPCKDGPVTGQKQPNAFTYSFIVDKVCPLSFTFPTRLGSTVTAEQMEVQKPLPNSVPGWQSHSGWPTDESKCHELSPRPHCFSTGHLAQSAFQKSGTA